MLKLQDFLPQLYCLSRIVQITFFVSNFTKDWDLKKYMQKYLYWIAHCFSSYQSLTNLLLHTCIFHCALVSHDGMIQNAYYFFILREVILDLRDDTYTRLTRSVTHLERRDSHLARVVAYIWPVLYIQQRCLRKWCLRIDSEWKSIMLKVLPETNFNRLSFKRHDLHGCSFQSNTGLQLISAVNLWPNLVCCKQQHHSLATFCWVNTFWWYCLSHLSVV